MAATVTVRWMADGALRTGGIDDIATARAAGTVWVDVVEPDEPALKALGTTFGLHPLAIEDCLHFPQRPKVDSYDTGPFIVWVTPHDVVVDGLNLAELDVFLGKDFLVTSHWEEIAAVTEVAKEADCVLPRGPAWLLHAILDRSVDAIFPLVDRVGDDLDTLEDELLQSPDSHELQRLYAAKRLLIQLHKVLGPERDALRALAREEAYVSQDAYLYFQDVGDHLARVSDTVDTYRDVASGVMDIYLSSVSNRLNVVMKKLTVVATIFMPGTLIVGFYGMNFREFPELAWPLGSFYALALSVVVTGGMLIWFKRSKWW